MLFESVQNEVLEHIAQQKSKCFKDRRPVPLGLDRLERDIKEAGVLERIFAILYRDEYTWNWFNPLLGKILNLGYSDTYRLARACASVPFFVTSMDCERCDECDE